jgi:hypothetical protein
MKYVLKEVKPAITEWYHGTPTPINSWSTEFVGQGTDQEGPGIYFTSNYEDAEGYARKGSTEGRVYTVSLNFNKTISETQKPNSAQLLQLIEWADDWEQGLQNIYGEEDYRKNWKMYKEDLLSGSTMLEACLDIWMNFYKHDSQGFCSSMVALGYDGFIKKKSFMNTYHAIVWNPKIIKST